MTTLGPIVPRALGAISRRIAQVANAMMGSVVVAGLMLTALTMVAVAQQPAQSVTGNFEIKFQKEITLWPAELPGGSYDTNYSSIAFRGLGGTKPYIFFISKGVLPRGLTLDASTGLLSGVPVENGKFKITVEARDATQATGSKEYTITIAASQAPPASGKKCKAGSGAVRGGLCRQWTGWRYDRWWHHADRRRWWHACSNRRRWYAGRWWWQANPSVR